MHIPVLLHEVVNNLRLKEGDIFVDGTLGSGGHSEAVLKAFQDVEVVGLDRDIAALDRSQARLLPLSSAVFLKHESFKNISSVLAGLGIREVNAILLDLGISSEQIDESQRGFSFKREEPLKMTMDSAAEIDASIVLNDWSEETLATIIKGFGEERYAKRIAAEIVRRRQEKPFKTTKDLVLAVEAVVPKGRGWQKIHPATRTFQAIRIAVNEELQTLEEALPSAYAALAPGGRLLVISFHSLEDRIVKNFMRERAKDGAKVLTKKPITPSAEEVSVNPRSRSAKLRVIEKV